MPHQFPLDYPTLKDGGDPIQTLNKEGYFVVRGLLSSKEVEESREAVSDICKKWYANFVETGKEGPDWEEVANRRPTWKDGSWKPEPGQEELGFRRLYRMTQFEDYFVRNCRHSEVSVIPSPCCSIICSACSSNFIGRCTSIQALASADPCSCHHRLKTRRGIGNGRPYSDSILINTRTYLFCLPARRLC